LLAAVLGLLSIGYLAHADGPSKPTPSPTPKPPEIRGVGLSLHSKDPNWDYAPLLRELPRHGVNQILVIFHFYQPTADSPAPARHPLKTPSDAVILGVIRRARSLGLEVGVMPILLLEKPGVDDWRGNLSPPDKQGRTRHETGYEKKNADWPRWFRGYGRVIEHYARLSQRGGATLFSVGSELSSTEAQDVPWRLLVKRVRKLFAGELTYSANWDHYQHVQVWSDLDYIGLSGYYELSRSHTAKPKELAQAWVKVRDRLIRWRAARGLKDQPFLFTEVGYPSIDGCASQPWNYTLKDKQLDLEEQRDCYQAFVGAWDGQPSLGGVFFYEWWGQGGSKDRSYTPRGKPAMAVLRRWFGAKH
jgi:hypothetical protein